MNPKYLTCKSNLDDRFSAHPLHFQRTVHSGKRSQSDAFCATSPPLDQGPFAERERMLSLSPTYSGNMARLNFERLCESFFLFRSARAACDGRFMGLAR